MKVRDVLKAGENYAGEHRIRINFRSCHPQMQRRYHNVKLTAMLETINICRLATPQICKITENWGTPTRLNYQRLLTGATVWWHRASPVSGGRTSWDSLHFTLLAEISNQSGLLKSVLPTKSLRMQANFVLSYAGNN